MPFWPASWSRLPDSGIKGNGESHSPNATAICSRGIVQERLKTICASYTTTLTFRFTAISIFNFLNAVRGSSSRSALTEPEPRRGIAACYTEFE